MKKLILLTVLTLGITGSMHASSFAAQAFKTATTGGVIGYALARISLKLMAQEAPTAARNVFAETPQTLVIEASKIKEFVTLACLTAGAVVGIRYVYELGKSQRLNAGQSIDTQTEEPNAVKPKVLTPAELEKKNK